MTMDFDAKRAAFQLPEGVIYLDGNSLGPLPRGAAARIARTTEAEWGEMLIGAWNRADWMSWPGRLGDRIGRPVNGVAVASRSRPATCARDPPPTV